MDRIAVLFGSKGSAPVATERFNLDDLRSMERKEHCGVWTGGALASLPSMTRITS